MQFLSLQHCKDQLTTVKISHVTVKVWLVNVVTKFVLLHAVWATFLGILENPVAGAVLPDSY